MTCSRYREAVSALADGEDGGLRPAKIAAHLAECAPCAGFASEATAWREQLSSLWWLPDVVPDAAPATLHAIAVTERRRRARRLAPTARWGLPAIVAGALPFLALGALSHNPVVPTHAQTPCTHAITVSAIARSPRNGPFARQRSSRPGTSTRRERG